MTVSISESISDKISWLKSLERFGIRLGLDTIRDLCGVLGNPQDDFRGVHIAGTNGKGSTAAIIYSILRQAGRSVALYSSPHLHKFNERIVVNGNQISDEELSSYINMMKDKIDAADNKIRPTFFEFTTALAFKYFSDKKVEFAVIETGLGGRLDATNIFNSDLSIITSIGKDHTQYLGDTDEEILREKLGIVKTGTRLICKLESALKKQAQEYCKIRAAVFDSDQFRITNVKDLENSQQFDYYGERTMKLLNIPLIGSYQAHNASLAIRAIETICPEIDEHAIRDGISKTAWPARFEIVSRKPLIILDCAHNLDGLKNSLSNLKRFHFNNLYFMVGFSNDKEINKMLCLLKEYSTNIFLTQSDYKPCLLSELKIAVSSLGLNIKGSDESPKRLLKFARSTLELEDCLLVTGSIYMVGLLYPDLSHLTPR